MLPGDVAATKTHAYPASVEIEWLILLVAIQDLLHVTMSKEDASPKPVMWLMSSQLLHSAPHSIVKHNDQLNPGTCRIGWASANPTDLSATATSCSDEATDSMLRIVRYHGIGNEHSGIILKILKGCNIYILNCPSGDPHLPIMNRPK